MFDPTTMVGFHTWLSLLALFSGIVVVFGLLLRKKLGRWTGFYLTTAVATSVTGFFLPAPHLLPSHIVGILSLLVLGLAILARYFFHFAGAWRAIYVVSTMVALFFLVFVAIAQAFAKIPALKALAPTQSEPPFAISELTTLVIFVLLIIAGLRSFRFARTI